MNTEDETFRRLRKISFDQLHDIIHNMPDEEFSRLVIDVGIKKAWLDSYGWTLDEFLAEVKMWQGG